MKFSCTTPDRSEFWKSDVSELPEAKRDFKQIHYLKKACEKADKAKKTQNKNNSNPGKGIGVLYKWNTQLL